MGKDMSEIQERLTQGQVDCAFCGITFYKRPSNTEHFENLRNIMANHYCIQKKIWDEQHA